MRNLQSEDFCSVCKEGLWLKLLRPLSFIDNITQVAQPDGTTSVTLDLLPLARFRNTPNSHEEAYSIFWYGASYGGLSPEWTNSTSALIGKDVTEFVIEILFSTEQVRVDNEGVLAQKATFVVERGGSSQVSASTWQNQIFRKRV
jgi:hypothetical protein